MKYFNKFAGVIAILCAMTLSTFGQGRITSPASDFIFSSCTGTCEFKLVSFNEAKNELSITVYAPTVPPGVMGWDSVKLNYFANVKTDLPANRNHESVGVIMSWQSGRESTKHANLSARMTVHAVQFDRNEYTFICKLTPEQVTFLKSFKGLPGQCERFSFSTLEYGY